MTTTTKLAGNLKNGDWVKTEAGPGIVHHLDVFLPRGAVRPQVEFIVQGEMFAMACLLDAGDTVELADPVTV